MNMRGARRVRTTLHSVMRAQRLHLAANSGVNLEAIHILVLLVRIKLEFLTDGYLRNTKGNSAASQCRNTRARGLACWLHLTPRIVSMSEIRRAYSIVQPLLQSYR